MEIIHLILGKANPDRMNGVNKVVHQLATRQAVSGRKVSVWGISKDCTHNYGNRAFTTRLFPAQRNPFALDAGLKQAIMAQKGKAVFHLHGGWIPAYASLSNVFSNCGIPFVLTPHGAYNTIAMERSKWTKLLYFNVFEKNLLMRAKKVHAIGESEVEGLNAIFPNAKSLLLPYGFEPPAVKPHAVPQSPAFIVGFVGRLDIHTKGLDILLDAFAPVAEKNANAALWILGDSPEKSHFESMIKAKKLENRVVLWGSRFGEEKLELMRQMSVFAHPSRNEGLPASVLEACSLGIPCVVSKATNVGSYIADYQAGIMLEDNNAAALTAALLQLQNPAIRRANLSENAQKMVREVFNWDKLLSRFDALYTA